MRLGVFVLAALAAGAGVCPCADTDFATTLLVAKNTPERVALLQTWMQSRSPAQLAVVLDAIEKTAGARYDAKDYPAALHAYEAALDVAQEAGNDAKQPFYLRRRGLCHALLGQNDAALTLYREGVVAAEKTGDEEMLAENLHGTANILQRIGRYKEALPYCEREYALTLKSGQPDAMIRALNTYAQTLGELGRLREGLPLQEKALELSRHSSQPGLYAANVGNLATGYAELGDCTTALRLLRSLSSPSPYDLDSIADCEVGLHHEAEAEKSFRASIEASTAPGLWRIHAGALINLGRLQFGLAKLTEARNSAEQALAVCLSQKDLAEGSQSLALLSEIAAREKDGSGAIAKAAEAVGMARESGSPDVIVVALVAQARAFEVSGRDADAAQTVGEALSIIEGERTDAPTAGAGLQAELGLWMPTYQYAVGHEIRTGKAVAALQMADRAKARVLLDMLDGGEPGFDAVADPRERMDGKLVRDQLSRARQLAIAKPGSASKAGLEAALRKEEDFNVHLFGRHPELALQRVAPAEIGPRDLSALLGDQHTALLSYFTLEDSVALFVVRAGDKPGVPVVKVFALGKRRKLDGLIRSFRSQIAARDLDYRIPARALFDALVAPAASALRGTDRWILSPDGALWDVPFQALIDPQGKHVLETHSLSYTPSLSVLRELRGKPAAPAGARTALLAVANPAVQGAAPIPDAEREVRAIAALYGPGRATLLTDDRASSGLFREKAGGADVIHIASHAETETNHPLESFLLLAPDTRAEVKDGALTARDLLGMHLRANLVVLSACETARGQIGEGDGVMGLGWAVLAAGARASVLSQWKVDSAATSDLMIDFHMRLTAGKPGSRRVDKAEALRQASLAAMRLPGRLHPFYWAGFIVVGDGR